MYPASENSSAAHRYRSVRASAAATEENVPRVWREKWQKNMKPFLSSALPSYAWKPTNKNTHWPEQFVALLVCVRLQLHNRVILLDELEQLWGVQLGVTVIIRLQGWGEKITQKERFLTRQSFIHKIKEQSKTCCRCYKSYFVTAVMCSCSSGGNQQINKPRCLNKLFPEPSALCL